MPWKLPAVPITDGADREAQLSRDPSCSQALLHAQPYGLKDNRLVMHEDSEMRLRGLEPPRGFPHEHLKLARIPNFATAAGSCNLPSWANRDGEEEANTCS